MTGQPACAELDGVTVRRAGRTVLEDVTFAVPATGTTGIVGPSGAGKSTLLRCLVRLTEPTAGRVTVDGRDVLAWDPAALRRHAALVPQAPVMLDGTVADNLRYGLDEGDAGRRRRHRARPARPDHALHGVLERAGLDAAYADRPAQGLSGGETMRVAIARALARHPGLLLLDEPTAALDGASAEALETSLARLAAADTALVVVTHDEALAARLATHAVRIEAGRVTAAGPPEEVLR